jgi:hypothetical protein
MSAAVLVVATLQQLTLGKSSKMVVSRSCQFCCANLTCSMEALNFSAMSVCKGQKMDSMIAWPTL